MKALKIGEGQKFDLTQVSLDGVTQEEAAKKNAKLINIFNALDANKNGKLDAEELARAMDMFGEFDVDDNKKLSKGEMDAIAKGFNEALGLQGKNEIKRDDIKDFLKNIMEATANDEKGSTSAIIKEADAQKAALEKQQKLEKLDNEAKKLGYEPTNNEGVYYSKEKGVYVMYDEASKTFKPAKYDNEKKSFEFKTEDEIKADEAAEAKKKADAAAAAEAEAKRKQEAEAPKSHKYTVQPDETFTSVIKKALKAQGIENPTAEQIEAAKEQFKKDNPDAVKTNKDGYEYLLVGSEVNLPAEVDAPLDKAAAEAKWAEDHPDLVWKPKTENTDATEQTDETPKPDGAENKKGKANGDLTAEEQKTADESAQKAGYRKTKCAGIYYDDANKQHYKYNTDTKQLEKFDAHQVFADGSYSKRWEDSNNIETRDLYDQNGNLIQEEYTNSKGNKVIAEYQNGKTTKKTTKYSDGSSSEFSGYDANDISTKRVNKDKNGNITGIYTFENKSDGYHKSQKVDEDGKPIGEPTYWHGYDSITKEEYEKHK